MSLVHPKLWGSFYSNTPKLLRTGVSELLRVAYHQFDHSIKRFFQLYRLGEIIFQSHYKLDRAFLPFWLCITKSSTVPELRKVIPLQHILRHSYIRNLLLGFSSKPKNSTCFFNYSKDCETKDAMMIVNQQMIPDELPLYRDVDAWLQFHL